jgi:serine/threonine-protein kinase
MNATSLDALAPHFERLRMLAPDLRAAELAALSLEDSLRERLARMLAADADDDDPLATAIAGGARQPPAACDERLGAYRLLHELGAGGMGTVFLAERADGQFTRRVAIKLLRGFPTRENVRRLRQERQILAGLDHPNIARLLDGGETAQGQPWLALEYVDGMPLLEHAASHAPGVLERLALFETMLDAVAHAHRHLVVHRDIKPANVMVATDGVVKLLDFGIAHLVEAGDSAPRETSTRIYSQGYASPEQKDGRAITTASDIYSLGILLCELLTGRRDDADLRRPVVAPLPLDAELAGIITRATAVDPRHRYSGAAEFADDLRRYREGRPVRAARWTRGYRLRKLIARHRLAFAAALCGLLVLVAFVWRLDHERDRALLAEAASQQALRASERDAQRARASLDFLSDAFAAAAPANTLSRQVSVRSLLDAARAKLGQRHDPALLQSMQRMLAHLYADLGEATIALELMRAGLAGIAPADRTEALRLAEDYDEYGSLLGTRNDGPGALAAANQASQWRVQFAPDDPVEHIRSLQSLAIGHHRNGEDEKAIGLLKEAATAARATPLLPLPVFLEVMQTLSSLHATNDDCEAALAAADEGYARADAGLPQDSPERLPQDSPERLPLMRSKASALSACGRFTEAESLLRNAIALQDRVVASGGSRMMVLTNDLALVLNNLGRYREAATLLQQSDQSMAGAGLADAEDRAISLVNIAGVLESAGDYPAALARFQEAMQVLDAGGIDADHQVRRRAERAEARTLALAGEHRRALERLTDLRARAARIEGEDSGEYAMVTWQLVVLARYMHQPDTGLPLLEEAMRRWHALAPDTHPIFLHARRARAGFALDRRDLARAERELQTAVDGFEKTKAPAIDLAIARSELAEVLLRQNRRVEARTLLAAALPVMREALLPTGVSRAAAERSATLVQ